MLLELRKRVRSCGARLVPHQQGWKRPL